MKELGFATLCSELPLVNDLHLAGIRLIYSTHWQFEHSQEQLLFDYDTLFGAFVLVATLLEFDVEHTLIYTIKENMFPLFQLIQSVFIARFDSAYVSRVQTEIDHCKFTLKQQAFIWQWVRQEINFCDLR